MTYKHSFVDDYPYLTYASNANATATTDEDAAQFDSRLDTLEGKFPIQTASIGAKQVTTAKIADAAVDTTQIKNKAVTTAKIADAAVDTTQIKDGAVTADKIAQ